MPVIKHLRALSDRTSYSRTVTTKWVREYREVEEHDLAVDVETGELIDTIRSEWVVSHRPDTRKRPVHRRVKRWRNMRGFEVVNDGLASIASIERIMRHHLPRITELESYDVSLLSGVPDEPDWFEPMTRDEVAAVLARDQQRLTAVSAPPER